MENTLQDVPIHTRTLSVTLRAGDDGALSFQAYVLDLRKRGFVPVAGDLQGTGIIHHMEVTGTMDPAARTILSIEARMPTVAFEASASTGWESCRDPVGAVRDLAGAPVGLAFAKAARTTIGGPLGCSHVLTLTQLLGSTASWALDEDQRLNGTEAPRRPSERIFRRDIVIDGTATSAGELALALQLNDLHFRPSPALASAPDRFAAQVEVRAAALLAMPDLLATTARVSERRRGAADFETAAWSDRPDFAGAIAGRPLRTGVTAELLRQFPSPGRDQPLLDALLTLAPATVQCFASFSDTWTQIPWMRGAMGETAGLPDSCYMWRRAGKVLGERERARTP